MGIKHFSIRKSTPKNIMKIFGLFLAGSAMAEKTIAPTERLSRVMDGLQDWIDTHLDVAGFPEAVENLEDRMEAIQLRMSDKFGEECAIHTPPKQIDNEIQAELDEAEEGDTRSEGGDAAVERMRKYIRVLVRVNRVYLGECKRPNKNKRTAEKLGARLERAFWKQQ